MVNAKVASAVAASMRDTRHRRMKACGRTSPRMAVTTRPASTACGTWYSSGISHSRAPPTSTTHATVAQPVLAPA